MGVFGIRTCFLLIFPKIEIHIIYSKHTLILYVHFTLKCKIIINKTRVICDPTGSTGCLRHEGKQVAPPDGCGPCEAQKSRGNAQGKHIC